MVTWKISEESAEVVLEALNLRMYRATGSEKDRYARILSDFKHNLKLSASNRDAIECFCDTNQVGNKDDLFETSLRINHTIRLHIPINVTDGAYDAELTGLEKLADNLQHLFESDLLPDSRELIIYNDCKSLMAHMSGRGKVKKSLYQERVLNLRYRFEEIAQQNNLQLHFNWMRRILLNQRLELPN